LQQVQIFCGFMSLLKSIILFMIKYKQIIVAKVPELSCQSMHKTYIVPVDISEEH